MSLRDDYFSNYYEKITNKGAVSLVSKIVHHSLERYPYSIIHQSKAIATSNSNEYQILEVGAGLGQHEKPCPFARVRLSYAPNQLKERIDIACDQNN